MYRNSLLRRVVSGGAVLALGAGISGAVIGALGSAPASAGSSGTTTYESDCSGTGAAAGQTAPFVSALTANAAPDPSKPLGGSFGAVGAYTGTLIGPLVAGLEANLTVTTIGLNVHNVVIGSTDGTATGTYSYSKNFTPVAANGRQLPGVSFSSGSNTLNGNFQNSDVGFAVAESLGNNNIPQGSVITAVTPGVSATISNNTTGASAGETLGLGGQMSFTDATLNTGSVFTTSGTNGSTSNIGIIGADAFDVVGPITLAFGGTDGVGSANCLLTGWGAGPTPGPVQTGTATPQLPPGATTQLVAASGGHITQPGTAQAITPPAAAFVNLVDNPPTPNAQTVNTGEGGSSSGTLTATPGDYPVGSFSLVGGSPQTVPAGNGNATITLTNPNTGAFTVSNTSSVAAVISFQFNACDTLPAVNGGPVCSTTPATVTVDIGTPPVIQPFTQQVNAGQLVLSCDSPSNYVTGNNTPNPVGNPLLQCPEFQFPSITLDGLEQQVSGTTGNTGGNPSASNPGTIYISDNRGDPTDSWTLTGTFIPTAIGAGNGQNPNASCAGVNAFCNSSVGAAALNTASNGAHDGQIAPSYLAVTNITCAADSTGAAINPPNLNPDATPTAGGNFAGPVTLCAASTGQSGGTFLFNATYTLTIPESVYAGNYFGTVQYTVA